MPRPDFAGFPHTLYSPAMQLSVVIRHRARVAEPPRLADGITSFTDAASLQEHGRKDASQRAQRAAGGVRGWSDAYGHALIATGRADLMLAPVINPWDCAPFPPILREAGSYFGDWSGNETIYGSEGISTTRTLLPEALGLLNGPEA